MLAKLKRNTNAMLAKLKRNAGELVLAGIDLLGISVAGSGAALVAFLGKAMLAVVLGAVALGFFLRFASRRRVTAGSPPAPAPTWTRVVAGVTAVVAVAGLVEATNFPVRFDQTGFAFWHWALVLIALLIAYSLSGKLLASMFRPKPAIFEQT